MLRSNAISRGGVWQKKSTGLDTVTALQKQQEFFDILCFGLTAPSGNRRDGLTGSFILGVSQ
jgi:hypothetical protein